MAGGFGELFGAVFKALGLAFVETLEGQARQRIVHALGGRNLRQRKAMQERLSATLGRPDFALSPEDRERVQAAVREALFSARGEPVGRALEESIQRAQWGAMRRLLFYQAVAPSPNVSVEVGSPSASEAIVVDRKTGERRHLRLVEPPGERAEEAPGEGGPEGAPHDEPGTARTTSEPSPVESAPAEGDPAARPGERPASRAERDPPAREPSGGEADGGEPDGEA